MKKKLIKNTIRSLALVFSVAIATSCVSCGGGGGNFSGTLNVLFPNSGVTDDKFVDNSTTRAIEEFTGQKVNYSQMLGSSEENDVSNALLAGEYSLIKMQRGSFDQNVVLETFYDITDLIEEYGKNLLEVIDDEAAWEACRYNGKLYAVPEVGWGFMYDNAIVFNMNDLAEVGITEVPSTLSEFTTALEKLQARFGGESNPFYHAFSMQGAEADQQLISGCFDMPKEFYVNQDDEIESWIYSDATDKYLHYMNDLYRKGYVSTSWASSTSATVMGLYAQGNCSVAVLPYWNIAPTCDSMVSLGKADSVEDALNDMGFALYLLGDGSNGSVDQREDNGWHLASINDVSYFCAIPNSVSEEEAIAAIKWMDAKIVDENYRTFITGKEGEGYEFVTKEEYEANEADGESTTKIVPIVEEDGETKYYKLLPEYNNIKDNSMYQTGGNGKIGKRYWPLREAQYNCWDILMSEADYDHVITSALAKCSVIESWSRQSITARSTVVTYIQNIINAKDDATFDRQFGYLKDTAFPKYWNECNADVQAWYQASKK